MMRIEKRGLKLIECTAALRRELLETRRRESCLFLELCAQISCRGIAQAHRNVGKREFVVDKKFLDAFDAMGNEKFLQRLPFYSRKEIGEVMIVEM